MSSLPVPVVGRLNVGTFYKGQDLHINCNDTKYPRNHCLGTEGEIYLLGSGLQLVASLQLVTNQVQCSTIPTVKHCKLPLLPR